VVTNPIARPWVWIQPQDQTVPAGADVTLGTLASGGGLKYEWSKNGTKLDKGTNGALLLTNISLADAGKYKATVPNSKGTNCSAEATLLVTIPAKAADPAPESGTTVTTLRRSTESSTNRISGLLGAIKAVTDMRGDEIYLRPASAYLRNSYPATSLQDNASSAWKNMLEEHAWHQIPILPSWWSRTDADEKSRQEIDKVFWQNVNRVRVAACGRTSYVITKDDIGNWYVSSYRGDPAPIIQGAESIALLGTGAQGLSAVKAGAATPAAGTAVDKQPGPLDREHQRAELNYFQASTNQVAMLTNMLSRLKSELIQDWNDTITDPGSKPSLAKLTNSLPPLSWLALDKTSKAPIDEQNTRNIVHNLKALRRFRNELDAKIISANFTNANDLTSVRAVVTNLVDTRALNFIKERRETVERYEQDLRMIGEIAQPAK
jgi:hypothetical protein